MLYEFGFKNYFSFKEGASISFRKNDEENAVYPVIGIKGANASGKTHIIKALAFLANFTVYSFSEKPDAKLRIKPFFNSIDESYFYAEFNIDNQDYLYETSMTEDAIRTEKLSLIKNEELIFERKENSVSFRKNFPELELIKFRKNVSIISTLNQYELLQKDTNLQNVFNFFQKIATNVGFLGVVDDMSVENVSKIYQGNDDLFSLVKQIIIKNDLGISDIYIEQMEQAGETIYFPIFVHNYENNGEKIPNRLTQYHQSTGTLRLYTELWKYFWIISQGGILALDEFDKHLHALILPHLLDLFENKENNPYNAQFLFTAHNTEIMDYLGKHRTVLVEKEDGESFCYRLDEIQGDMLNGNKAISQLYLAGRLGGVPNL